MWPPDGAARSGRRLQLCGKEAALRAFGVEAQTRAARLEKRSFHRWGQLPTVLTDPLEASADCGRVP